MFSGFWLFLCLRVAFLRSLESFSCFVRIYYMRLYVREEFSLLNQKAALPYNLIPLQRFTLLPLRFFFYIFALRYFLVVFTR